MWILQLGGLVGTCKPLPLFCYISLLVRLYETPFLLITYIFWFFAGKLSFGSNVLLLYSSCCFPYFLLYENCLFLLSLKTQQWCMPTMHYAFHNSVTLTWPQVLLVFNSCLLYQTSLLYIRFSDCFHSTHKLS